MISRPGVSTHFDQGLTYKYTGERHGLPCYMTAPASWNMLEALSGVRADRLRGALELDPYRTDALRIPVFLTGCAFELIIIAGLTGKNLSAEFLRQAAVTRRLARTLNDKLNTTPHENDMSEALSRISGR